MNALFSFFILKHKQIDMLMDDIHFILLDLNEDVVLNSFKKIFGFGEKGPLAGGKAPE